MDEEKRNLMRWSVDWPARVRLKYKSSLKNFDCNIKNINFKGLQFTSQKKLPGFGILKLSLILSGNITLDLKVKVASHKVLAEGLNLYSFHITEIADSDKELIFQLLQERHLPDLVKFWWKGVK